MAKTKTISWDPAQHLESEADMAAFLVTALDEGDPDLVGAALGDIARAAHLQLGRRNSPQSAFRGIDEDKRHTVCYHAVR
jgi:hypothetical protein